MTEQINALICIFTSYFLHLLYVMIQQQFYPDAERSIWMRSSVSKLFTIQQFKTDLLLFYEYSRLTLDENEFIICIQISTRNSRIIITTQNTQNYYWIFLRQNQNNPNYVCTSLPREGTREKVKWVQPLDSPWSLLVKVCGRIHIMSPPKSTKMIHKKIVQNHNKHKCITVCPSTLCKSDLFKKHLYFKPVRYGNKIFTVTNISSSEIRYKYNQSKQTFCDVERRKPAFDFCQEK